MLPSQKLYMGVLMNKIIKAGALATALSAVAVTAAFAQDDHHEAEQPTISPYLQDMAKHTSARELGRQDNNIRSLCEEFNKTFAAPLNSILGSRREDFSGVFQVDETPNYILENGGKYKYAYTDKECSIKLGDREIAEIDVGDVTFSPKADQGKKFTLEDLGIDIWYHVLRELSPSEQRTVVRRFYPEVAKPALTPGN